MPRFSVSALFSAACCLLPAMALELTDLHLPLTRSEADKALSRDYTFRVMEDMTVRRSWQLPNRTVSIDFSPKQDDKALLIFIDYSRPVTPDAANEDAARMVGTEPTKWQALSQKRALRLGMEAAEGFKLSGDRYCFRELDEQGNVLRLVYFAGMPTKEVRWELAEDKRETGKTAMGSRAAAGSSEFLWLDEERRRGVSASSSAASLASAAAAVVADAPGANAAGARKQEMIARPEEPVDYVARAKEFAAQLTPTHYAIGGGVVAVLLLLRCLARAREAKRRAMVADYIMKHGAIRTGGQDKRRK